MATASNASNLVNNTITGTGHVVSCEKHSQNELTIFGITFIKEHFLRALDCSIKFIHWDTVPMQNNN
jgi:hypothetical protein